MKTKIYTNRPNGPQIKQFFQQIRGCLRRYHYGCAFSLIVPALLISLGGRAQTIQFTSTPVTSGTENTAYSYALSAVISNSDSIHYAALTLPSWLTLGSGGAASGTKINNSSIPSPGGVAGDANGNFYAVANSGNIIYKIAPDGSTSVLTTRSATNYNYGAIVVGHYLYVSIYNYSSGGIERFDLNQTNPAGTMIYTGDAILSMTEKDGYLYGACYATGKVVSINLVDNTSSYYATGFGAGNPFGLGFTSSGDLLIAYYGGRALAKYSNGTISTVLSGFPNSPTDVKVDAAGNVYISFYGAKIRKYKPDFSSYVEVSGNTLYCWGMTLTSAGTLIYGDNSGSNVYTLQTGATLSGTPSHKDVGVHPVTIRVTNGTVSEDQAFTITVSDPNPPTVVKYFPAQEAVAVSLDTTLVINFSETVVKGNGNIYLRSLATGEILQTIDIAGTGASIADSILFIKLGTLPALSGIYITADAGVVKDVNGNDYAGISDAASWTFVTMEQPKDPQSITFVADSAVVYGVDDYIPGASSSAGLSIQYESSDTSVVTIVNGKLHIKKAGGVVITATQPGNDDFLPATAVTQQLTVNKKDITLTLNASPAISKVYDGNSNIELNAANYSLQSVVNNDDVQVTGMAAYDSPAASTNAGITVNKFVLGGTASENYNLVTNLATVTGIINPKPLTCTLNAVPVISKTYNGDNKAVLQASNLTLNGLVGDDEVTVTGNAAFTDKNTGVEKTITVTKFLLGGSAKANYRISTDSALVKGNITPAQLIISAENKTKKQGIANPALTFSYAGLAAGDSPSDLTALPKATTAALVNSPIGYYDIVVDGAASNNYNISFVNGTITVVPAGNDHLKVWTSSSTLLQVRVSSETVQASTLMLYTSNGQPVMSMTLQLQPGITSATMPVGNLTPGVYIVNIYANNFKELQKVKIK